MRLKMFFCGRVAILFRPQCVSKSRLHDAYVRNEGMSQYSARVTGYYYSGVLSLPLLNEAEWRKPTIIGSDNGLSPGRCRAIIRTSAGILLIGPLGTNFSETLIRIQTFSLKENTFETVVWKMTAILSRPQYVKSSHCSLFDDRATVPAPDLQMHYRNVLRPANERRCYDVTPSLVGWAQT